MNYKLTVTRSKNAKCFYIQTTYRKRDGRLSSKTVKKLGNETFIKENYGVDDAEAWARGELERMRQTAREEKQGLVMELHPDRLVTDTERIFNGGDIFIEKVLTLLGLRDICDEGPAPQGRSRRCCRCWRASSGRSPPGPPGTPPGNCPGRRGPR